MGQNVFPKKIKLATLLMIASGILLFCEFILITWLFKTELAQMDSGQYNILWFVLTKLDTILVATLFVLFAHFLLKNKKWAWFAAMVLLLKEVVAGITSIPLLFSFSDQISFLKELQVTTSVPIFTFFIVATIISVLSFILILMSLIFLVKYRKNYWQIAS